ncbi:SMI1/KNR4 family protein [Clostridium sp. DJ247]|uniref:SMI1/KNR4 family protein n=1 Tax=Clostridium sp. DJ247 TaxID=2726188 RepID=UPI0016253B64|nr:SMI1/KNR4 family protein [Clostridium sp. DJ247]MBC2582759.1 SMI1/KNR4 family protein [Clostridium sp. DJ247]
MDIFEEISGRFSIDANQCPATEEEIVSLKKFSTIEVPLEYLEIIRQATEIEIKVDNEMYIRIWGPNSCIELNDAYYVQKYLPNSLAIGDDEGGGALVYLNGKDGFGIYMCRFADLDIEEAVKIAPSLYDLLVNNVGIDIAMSGYM